MLKKVLIITFIILSFIFVKEVVFKYDTGARYVEIVEEFKKDYEFSERFSLDTLNQYKIFLNENRATKDVFLVDSYIRYIETNGISSEEEIKKAIHDSRYLNSKFLGGLLLYNYYLENNRDIEAKELICEIFNQITFYQCENNRVEISYFIEMIASIATDKSIPIDILESLLDNSLPAIVELNIIDTLRYLYLYVNNYALASEASIQSIIKSSQLNLNEQTAEALVELAQLFKRLGGIESGIRLVKESLSIEIEDEFKNADLKTYALLTLGELYLSLNDYVQAKTVLGEISKYEGSMSIDHYRDVEIVKANLDARVAIMENKLDLAEKYLNYSKYLQEIDETEYYLGKKEAYLLALGTYYQASNQNETAIQLYESMLHENQNNNYLLEKVLESLTAVVQDPNKKNEYYKTLLDLREAEQEKRYGDYTFNLLEIIQKENELVEQYQLTVKSYRLILALIFGGGIAAIILYKQIQNLQKRNKQDVLVSAYNRKYFDITYKKLLKKQKSFSIIMFDLDNFKKINDTFGHHVGDIVLIKSCKAIQPLLNEKCSMFRYGGEEFVIIIEDSSRENVLQLAENIRFKIESLSWKEDMTTTVSMGVAYSKVEGNNVLNKADENLYISKSNGKNRVTE
ncbi:GGDEF domain-containing protein [Turicibacter sanguinis]|uniref:GGDEF domain-containing protein n=1 Tax=Turicibacter sanguinis TaxID=154288 RepID=UPI00232ED898|nr:GGDEF domain-containing protein [Turicibacter sanguinis]MDB8573645.1 GGDEF domain-containing protein [Turicibacter sanguinis]MDB8577128.1 GGDEF domain-containing protein [Turicibacter sanguinis]MDB8582441.1 GGDEF domain-containing protein [Turicibacter sanguinis]MDB8585434.1 GGDEF domain-containing protein [Turicibacter sanguinis]MDB8596233.1 GGDEF domain-containing protein [Turicibacter sanguinis]